MPEHTAPPHRRLGLQGPMVSAIGLGCMGMSEFYGASDDTQSLRTLHAAVDRGINLLDTADMYGVGHNERLLAHLLVERRDEVVLATKFGILRGADGARLGVSGHPDHVRRACDASLHRLGVDHIDLYYQHRVDPQVPIEDTVGAMAALVAAGKVRHLGLSEASANTLRRAAAVHPIAALQSEYSLWSRDVEADILPTCRELGIGFVAYSPLGRGFLTGAMTGPDILSADDFRRGMPRFSATAFSHNLRLVDALRDMAEAHDATPAQIALAWLLAQGEDIVPIPGTRRSERLDENLGATRIALGDAQRAALQRMLDALPVDGTRYPAAAMALLEG